MRSESGEGGLLPVSSLVVLVTLAVGAIWAVKPLRSFSPPQATVAREPEGEPQNVLARLWQDPFEAVQRHRDLFTDKSGLAVSDGVGHTLEVLASLTRGPSVAGRRLLVMGVMLPGGSLVNAIEARRQARYAVVSALVAAGFEPSRQDRIGYVKLGLDSAANPGPEGEVLVPFEHFHPGQYLRNTEQGAGAVPARGGRAKAFGGQVLVLWLDEPRLAGKVPALVKAVGDALAPLPPLLPTACEHAFVLLGPASSNGLIELMRSLPAQPSREGRWLSILNWRATAPEPLLLAQLRPSSAAPLADADPPRAIAEFMRQHGVGYERTMCTDDALVRELLHELALRGALGDRLYASEECDRIALVSELDTFYGRSLPLTFESVLTHLIERHFGRKSPLEALHECFDACDSHELMAPALRSVREGSDASLVGARRFLRVSYLRGLDGSVPRLPGEVANVAGAGPDSQKELEMPVGPSQLDYVRRHVSELGKGTRTGIERPRLAAVGVLGSDLTDKQLVMQALRRTYPGVPFFTTDLDARLFHPSQYGWSQNLLVASAHALVAPSDEHVSMPPFRSTYQVSAYRAVQRALNARAGSEGEGAGPDSDALLPRAQVFEVGRRGAYPLHSCGAKEQRAGGLMQEGQRWPWMIPLGAMLVLVLYLGTSPVGAHHLLGWLRRAWRRDRRRVVFLGGLAASLPIGMLVLAHLILAQPDGEPLLLFEGISIWPTEGVRLVAAILCVAGLLVSAHRSRRNSREIQRRLGLGKPRSRARSSLRDALRPNRISVLRRRGLSVGRLDVKEAWARYRADGAAGRVALRVGCMVVLYLALGFLLLGVLGFPRVPARGSLARTVDKVVLVAAVLSLSVLLFYVIDGMRTCTGFVRVLADGPSKWPKPRCHDLLDRDLGKSERGELGLIQLVGSRTRVVGNMILLPFFALLLMILSRLSHFDGWDWPLALVLIFSSQAILTLIAAHRLRSAAERARGSVLARLNERLVGLRGSTEESERARAAQIEALVQEIRGFEEGAFAPWSKRPALRAILMPFSGVSAVAMLDLITKAGSGG